jgi:outer membrane receptor protein involved in Fe transport
MRISRFFAASALASTAWFGATDVAFAQDATPSPADKETVSPDMIIVTGSRIRRPNLDSAIPIVSISGESIRAAGQVSVGDYLNNLPSLRATYSQSNSTRFLGTTGLNLLDLRGLGTQRTLVLVNGRRHVASDILNNGVSPDINTFPTDLIDRVDIVTGGSSAVYGSDAIAGVVNFILKENFEGLELRGRAGVSTYGDAGNYELSALGGINFADGRGNVSVNLEYSRQNSVFGSSRPEQNAPQGFIIVDSDVSSSSDGVPDRVFLRDFRSTTISIGGLISLATPSGACGRVNLNPGSAATTAGLTAAFNCTYLFQPDGTLIPQTGTRVGLAPNGNFLGGNGSTGRERSTQPILPTLDRYTANLLAHYEFSEAADLFIEAKYSRTDSQRIAAPAFFQGSTIGAGVDLRERPRFDNPFLSTQAQAAFQAARAFAGLAPATAATRITLRQNLVDVGSRTEFAKRETYRIVGGLRGTFNDDWNYEISANYGEFKEATQIGGNLNQQRFLLAIDAVRNPASGQIVCRSQIDPAAALIFPYSNDDDFARSLLAADVAACVPYNPFGEGASSQASRDYLVSSGTSIGKISQFDVSGFVNGDTSGFFNLPGGPIGFVVGGEYRRETNFFQTSDIIRQGITFYNALPTFTSPAFEVKEAFGEIRIPILKDVPFFQELTLTGAGRVSDYSSRAGTVFAYNGQLQYSPFKDLRLRAGYARAIRAPNLNELFSQQSQNFATGFVDPCSARNIATGSNTRAANCLAAGVPTSYDYVYLSSLEILSGGNPNLKAETSRSLTLGAVYRPSFVPGLSLTVDYYNITAQSTINSPTAQQIANNCYDLASLNNAFCGLFKRNGATTAATGEDPYRIIEGSLQQVLVNFSKSKVRGIDVDLKYDRQIDNIGKFGYELLYTYSLQNDDFIDASDPNRTDRSLFELGDPEHAFNLKLNFESGPVLLEYGFRYLSKQVVNTYEDIFTLQGRPPENADYAEIQFYPATVYHDIRVAFDINKKFELSGGVTNLLNTLPPFGLSGTGGGSGIYDARGRFFYMGFKAKF